MDNGTRIEGPKTGIDSRANAHNRWFVANPDMKLTKELHMGSLSHQMIDVVCTIQPPIYRASGYVVRPGPLRDELLPSTP